MTQDEEWPKMLTRGLTQAFWGLGGHLAFCRDPILGALLFGVILGGLGLFHVDVRFTFTMFTPGRCSSQPHWNLQ